MKTLDEQYVPEEAKEKPCFNQIVGELEERADKLCKSTKENKRQGIIDRFKRQKETLEVVFSDDVMANIITEASRHKPEYREKMLRGSVFECISKANLIINGELSEEYIGLSDMIIDFSDNPLRFIDNILDFNEDSLPDEARATYQKLNRNYPRLKSKYSRVRKHNDTVAIDLEKDEATGDVNARVVGTYEMKNYDLKKRSGIYTLGNQIEQASVNLLDVTKFFKEYYPLIETLSNKYGELPQGIDSVEVSSMKRYVVQPQGIYYTEEELDRLPRNTQMVTVDFSKNDLEVVYKGIYDHVSNSLKKP